MDAVTLSIALPAALAAFAGLAFVVELLRSLPRESAAKDRSLPLVWRLGWPVLAAGGRAVRPLLSAQLRHSMQCRLAQAGLDQVIAPQHFVAAQLLLVLATTSVAAALKYFEAPIPWLALLPLILMGVLWPVLWLRDVIRARRESLLRGLPFLIDLLAMAVESGLPLAAALSQAVERLPAAPLRDECRRLVRDIKAGMPRDEALRTLASRLDIAAVTQFVMALSAAQRDGGAVVRVLRAQAEQQRNERFLRAEHRAAQAPVRVLFPLIVFIFPGTLAIVLFPVVSRMMAEVSRWQ